MIKAPAKLNLMLHVTGRRADGYHTLQSLMAFTDIGDTLDIREGQGFSLEVTGPFAAHAPAGDGNLVLRAARAMERAAGRRADMAVTLTKTIPAGAGLGGGSADAAAAMHAINRQWGGVFDEAALCAIGLTLGAELPVCLRGRTQWVEGIGETLSDATVPPMDGVVVWPGVALATGDVFRAYEGTAYAQPLPGPPEVLTGMRNDLFPAATTLQPVVGMALRAVEASCLWGRMTGSGSSVFGICRDADDAKEAAANIAAVHPGWWVRIFRIS